MTGDLHCHSRHSDGSATVESIVSYAVRLGLDYVALTDHDTMAGVDELCERGRRAGLGTIPGVECSARDGRTGRPVHLLCYLPRNRVVLQAALDRTLVSRAETKWQMVEHIMESYPLTRGDVLRYSRESASVHEPHIMQALADLGYTNTVIGPLMDELIGKNGSCYVPNVYPEARDIARLIQEAGGIAVVAHPGQFDSLELAEELARDGLIGGIECHHPRNSPEVTQKAIALAARHDLIVTGGSDFHGQFAKRPHPLGTCVTDGENIRRLLAVAGQ